MGSSVEPKRPDPELSRACAPWNPSVRAAWVTALVANGGSLVNDVAGWQCTRLPAGGYARIVFVQSQQTGEVTPVFFEDGRLVSTGWELLEKQPDRYGAPLSPADIGPPDWNAPEGWAVTYTGVSKPPL